jgi:hypothetical protein
MRTTWNKKIESLPADNFFESGPTALREGPEFVAPISSFGFEIPRLNSAVQMKQITIYIKIKAIVSGDETNRFCHHDDRSPGR